MIPRLEGSSSDMRARKIAGHTTIGRFSFRGPSRLAQRDGGTGAKPNTRPSLM